MHFVRFLACNTGSYFFLLQKNIAAVSSSKSSFAAHMLVAHKWPKFMWLADQKTATRQHAQSEDTVTAGASMANHHFFLLLYHFGNRLHLPWPMWWTSIFPELYWFLKREGPGRRRTVWLTTRTSLNFWMKRILGTCRNWFLLENDKTWEAGEVISHFLLITSQRLYRQWWNW